MACRPYCSASETDSEISEREAERHAEEETCSGGRNAWHDVADEFASLAAQLQRMVDERGAENSEPPTKEDK